MRTGYVDETWAREHHEYWYNEVKSGKGAGEGRATGVRGPPCDAAASQYRTAGSFRRRR